MDGTSFSAPIVSGFVALMKSQYPGLKQWEIIDRLKAYNNLDANNLFNSNLKPRCRLESVSSQLINNGDVLTFYGSHIPSNLSLYLVNPNKPNVDINLRNFIKQESASYFQIDTSKMNLDEGWYTIKEDVCGVAYGVRFNLVGALMPTSSNPPTNHPQSSINPDIKPPTTIDKKLSEKMKGKILLQVELHGEAWYINPKDGLRYYMANGEEAYGVMRHLGVGISNINLDKIKASKVVGKKYSGKIFLQVEAHGEAYYIDFSGNAHYLKDGAAAYDIMRSLGLGITNSNLDKIAEGVLN